MRGVASYSTLQIIYFLDRLSVLTRDYHLILQTISVETSFPILAIHCTINICLRLYDLTTCIVKI